MFFEQGKFRGVTFCCGDHWNQTIQKGMVIFCVSEPIRRNCFLLVMR